MMKFKKIKNKINKSLFVKSYRKFDRRIAFIAAYDLFFYISLAILIVIMLLALKWNFTGLEKTAPTLGFIIGSYVEEGELPELSQEMKEDVKEIESFFKIVIFRTIMVFVLFYIAAISVLSFFKGLLWSWVLETKFNRLFFKKFLYLNLVWFTIWFLILIFIFKFINLFVAARLIIAELFLFLYFTILLCSLFDVKKGLFKLIKEALIVGLRYFYFFVLYYILAGVVLLILFYIIQLITLVFPSAFVSVVFWLLFFIYLAWLRIYISSIVKSVVK